MVHATGDSNAVVLNRLQALIKAQDTRMNIYKEFNDAFQDYLHDRCPEEQYLSICRIATEGFQEVSSEVQTIEQALAEEGRNDLSQAVRRLQEKEKDKLQLTVHLQIYTIESRKGEKDYDTTIQEHRERLDSAISDIGEIWDEIRQEAAELSFAVAES
ncbi:hypothetical protein O0I10_009341 [Lichtheimia ornata]|uniref:Uncharacterized protein n=1 Tax=Lichtheimia ornata TaxID=688661 RepID=A0AAD7UYM4_9FUNG|nr:uncharacterized protein O0I10_009341 [Lichtheimia ornata]KAJ8654945.1 hypothetical protein O0I10_009341 [Lichtheimia ornata]